MPIGLSLFLVLLGQILIIQQQRPWTLFPGSVCLVLGLFLLSRGLTRSKETPPVPIKPASAQEPLFFLGLLGLAVFFRLYRLSEIPSGIARDEASVAVVAAEMVRGLRPSFEALYHSTWTHYTGADAYFGLAGWFALFQASKISFCLFYIFFSILTLVLIYWSFRQLADAATALESLFLISVMAWPLFLVRSGHPAGLNLFFMFGCLSFLIYGCDKRKIWALMLSALFLGGGLYGYPAFKAFPLLVLAVGLYESKRQKLPRNFILRAVLFPGFVLLFATWPLWVDMFHSRYLTGYDSYFIWNGKGPGETFVLVFQNFAKIVLSLDRTGDPTPTYNVLSHRLLDDGTALFFLLGLLSALPRLKERKYFYGTLGMGVMLLPALLSSGAQQSPRYLGIAPFAAFLAAEGFNRLRSHFEPVRGSGLFWLFGLLIPAFVISQNFKVYFLDKPSDPLGWHWADTEANIVGQKIAEGKDEYEYYLSPVFFGNFSAQFQCLGQEAHMHSLELPEAMSLPAPPGDRGLYFFLQEGRTGVLSLLQSIYPGGSTEKILDPVGRPSLYLYRVSRETTLYDLDVLSKKRTAALPRGLLGEYRFSTDWGVKPSFIQRDPLINFSSHNDFPVKSFPPLSVHWSGKIDVPVSGDYRFLVLTDDWAKAIVKGVGFAQDEEKTMVLKKGLYPLEIYYQKARGLNTCLHFLWKKPGSDHYDVVPYQAFRN